MSTAHDPAPHPADSLFDEDFLRRLERLRLVSRHLLPGGLKGEHRARRRGAGVEFADYRPYVAGDDVRHVDWRAYLRLGKLLLRRFEEEGDLPIYIFLDISRSMVEGGLGKLEYGRRLAAALCFVGLLNLDRISLIAYADGIERQLSGLRGQGQVWTAFRFLEELGPVTRPTRLGEAVRRYFTSPRRAGLVAVISDFLDPTQLDGLDLIRHFRHDVLLLHLVDDPLAARELGDEVLLVDSEDGSRRHVRLTPSIERAYARLCDAQARELDTYARRCGWTYLQAATRVPFDELLLEVLRQGRLA